MAMAQYLTLDNILKVLLAIAVGILLYNVFFKKTEKYYNYQSIDKVSDHAYPMDYEDEYVEDTDEYVVDDDETEMDVVDDVTEEVYDEAGDGEDDIVDEVVLDDAVDEEMYEYEETDEPYDDSADAEDDMNGEIPDEIYEEADEETTADENVVPFNQSYEFLYSSDVEDGLQENFVLYENEVGVDSMYEPVKNEYLQ